MKKSVPELKKQLRLTKKIHKDAKKEAKTVSKTALRAIDKDPTMKVQRALESQYQKEETRTPEEYQRQPATNPGWTASPTKAEGQLAAVPFTVTGTRRISRTVRTR